MKIIISLIILFLVSYLVQLSVRAKSLVAGVRYNVSIRVNTGVMQIDDTIMQKTYGGQIALTNKKYFLTVKSEVIDGRIFLSGKVEPEEKIQITKLA